LQAVTAAGWVMASLFSVLIAANLRMAFGDDRKSCKTTRKLLTMACSKAAHQQQVGTARRSTRCASRR
jgi:hypothetical protein